MASLMYAEYMRARRAVKSLNSFFHEEEKNRLNMILSVPCDLYRYMLHIYARF